MNAVTDRRRVVLVLTTARMPREARAQGLTAASESKGRTNEVPPPGGAQRDRP